VEFDIQLDPDPEHIVRLSYTVTIEKRIASIRFADGHGPPPLKAVDCAIDSFWWDGQQVPRAIMRPAEPLMEMEAARYYLLTAGPRLHFSPADILAAAAEQELREHLDTRSIPSLNWRLYAGLQSFAPLTAYWPFNILTSPPHFEPPANGPLPAAHGRPAVSM
jgi:hypothetical protein